MAWRECKSLLKLREQVNAMWPDRDRASDGTIGDMAHSQRTSDHNPNAAGVVTAMDIDRELGGQPDGSNDGPTVAILVAKLQAGRDPRIKYLIWNAQTTVPGDITRWKPYHGANAHKHHCHISVSSSPKLYDDDREWNLGADVTVPANHPTPDHNPATPTPRDLRIGDTGDDVRAVQKALKLAADGIFGRGTRAAVIHFQSERHMTTDGIVGAKTRHELGL